MPYMTPEEQKQQKRKHTRAVWELLRHLLLLPLEER